MREQKYESEDVLQALLAQYPNVLAARGSSGPEDTSRWLLLAREAEIPDNERGSARWSLDHLFVDQDAIPTFVEVKRSSDTRIRREVVGQMLDYAANVVEFLSADVLRARFATASVGWGTDPDDEVQSTLGVEPDVLWARLQENLDTGRLRLVFVADAIPEELRRIVEFLNTQMTRTEVIAIEVRQFVGTQGGVPVRTLVPRLIGRTTAAEIAKASAEPRRWTEDDVLNALEAREPTDAVVARRILGWAAQRELRLWFGQGRIDGSIYVVLDTNARSYSLFALWTYGRAATLFADLKKTSPFRDETLRNELRNRLSAIPGVVLPPDAIEKYPSLPLAALREPDAQARFFDAFSWVIDECRRAAATDDTLGA